jgi:two-component system response regulator YesN
MNVLIVDDEPLVRDGLSNLIDWQRLGFTIVGPAVDGVEAQEIVERTPPDIVLTDIKMPVIDGMALIRWLRQHYPAIVTIIVSGYDQFDLARQAIELGAISFLLKPVEPSELIDCLFKARDIVRHAADEASELTRLRRLSVRSSEYVLMDAVSRLVRGVTLTEEHREHLARVGVSENHAALRVGIFTTRWSPFSDFSQTDEDTRTLRQNLWERIIGYQETRRVIVVPETEMRFVVLAWGADSSEAATVLRDMVDSSRRVLQRLGFEPLSGGASLGRRRFGELFDAYREAESAMNANALTHSIDIQWFTDSPETEVAPAQSDVEVADHIGKVVAAVEERDLERLPLEARRFVDALRERRMETFVGSLGTLLFAVRTSVSRSESSIGTAWVQDTLHAVLAHEAHQMRGMTLVHSLQELVAALQESERSAHQGSIARAKKILESRYADSDLSVEAIAAEIGMSANYLSSLFRSRTGVSLIDYLTDQRIEHAKTLLTTTSLKNYEIAERCGYQYPSYFSTVFRTRTGTSPTDFRRNRKKPGEY